MESFSYSEAVRSDVILDECQVPNLELQLYAEVGESVEVIVSEVRTPHKFSMQLKRFKIKINRFMNKLQLFYSRYNHIYTVKDFKLTPRQMCVALCEINGKHPKWYRAKVLKSEDLYSIIELIDYGTIIEVGNDNLRYLYHRFAELPAQAIRGHLANIKPYNDRYWSEQSSKAFFDMTFKKELVAEVVDLNYGKLWLSVCLTDTVGDEIHINDMLVEKNLATLNFVHYNGHRDPSLFRCSCNLPVELQMSLQPEDLTMTADPPKEDSTAEEGAKGGEEPKPRKKYTTEELKNPDNPEMFL